MLTPWLNQEWAMWTYTVAVSLACLVEYRLTARVGFDPGDEGYLWYGLKRIRAGEWPIVDFRAYDPGRYVLCGAISRLFGSSLPALRAMMAGFKTIALALAGWTLTGMGVEPLMVYTYGVVAFVWLRPRHKSLDQMLSIVILLAFLQFNDAPLVVGVVVGLAFFFGLNHGLYAMLGLIVAQLLSLTVAGSNAWQLGIGLAAGLSPFAVMIACCRRFPEVYWKAKIAPILRRGHANLPRPIPWPWKLKRGTGQAEWITGWGLVLLISTLLAGLSLSIFEGFHGAACLAVGTAYLHHAMSRADLSHLKQSVHPALICMILFLPTDAMLLFACPWLALSLWLAFHEISVWRRHRRAMAPIRLGNQVLIASPWVGRLGGWIERQLDSELDVSYLVTPNLVGFYAAFDKKSPVYDTFPVYPASPEAQARMLSQLKRENVQFAVVAERPLDGREDLRFSATHPDVWRELQRSFQPPEDAPTCPAHLRFLVRKPESPHADR